MCSCGWALTAVNHLLLISLWRSGAFPESGGRYEFFRLVPVRPAALIEPPIAVAISATE